MEKPSKEQIKRIEGLLKEGRPLPERYKNILFPEGKKEYELIYAGKEREEDILANTMRAPLQPVKTFCNGVKTKDGWTNGLIFGDNLQILKEIYADQQGENILGTKNKIKLIYIDPPFATKQEFRGSQDQRAYQDKIAGAKFLEFLRKRLIFLREILADDGSIYVHLDWKKGHYVKVLMDEVFGEQNFRNDVVWCYTGASEAKDGFPAKHDMIFFYARFKLTSFNYDAIRVPYKNGSEKPAKWEDGLHKKNPLGTKCLDWFSDVPSFMTASQSKEKTGFPTQKPEKLLERLIKASSNSGDIVLDCFAGAGTTGAVAEKLGRRWIMVDSSKLAIYTIQKRLLNLRKDIGNKGIELTAKPFTLYNAGLYDYQKLKDLPWEEYREFVLKFFQCRDGKHTISGVELDGYFQEADVLVFNYQKYKEAVLDYGFIDDLHGVLGDKVGKRFFIVAPAASVDFAESYISKDNVQYYILRIPYSIIDELHRPGGWRIFEKLKQPKSERDINDIAEGIGFDFIRMPEMKCKYYLGKTKGIGSLKLDKGKSEAVIQIQKFESTILSKEPLKYKNLETLSMVMIDYNYDGKIFDFDKVFYAEDLKQQSYEIRFDPNKIKKQMMIIYCDIFGNEKKEIKTLSDFKSKS